MYCVICGDVFATERAKLGYRVCLPCGEAKAKEVKHMIVPVPKSNYVYAHSREDLLSPYSHKGNR